MLRTALRPKWLALLALALAVVVTFGWLGLWQLNVSQQKDQAETLARVQAAPEAPIGDVIAPGSPFRSEHVSRAVTAEGRYDASGQMVVTGRRQGDRTGRWVLTPLVVEATGARLAVVRGFVPDGTPIPPPPGGTVTIRGTLQPQEGPPDEPQVLPAGQMQTVDLSSLVNVWPGDVYGGFVFAAAEEPPAAGAAAQVTPVPPPVVESGKIQWRNFAYAIQWWIFAAFVVYVWWRMVRDDHVLNSGPDRPAAGSDAAGGSSATGSPVSSSGGFTP